MTPPVSKTIKNFPLPKTNQLVELTKVWDFIGILSTPNIYKGSTWSYLCTNVYKYLLINLSDLYVLSKRSKNSKILRGKDINNDFRVNSFVICRYEGSKTIETNNMMELKPQISDGKYLFQKTHFSDRFLLANIKKNYFPGYNLQQKMN